jgi:hypothetical protein
MVTVSFVPPEAEQSHRRSFSIKEKRDFVHTIDIIVSTGVSRRQAYARVSLPYLYYAHFKRMLQKVEALENSDVYVPFKTNGTACKIHAGQPSLLCAIKDDLACFVLHARHSGIQVSTHIIHQEACRLLLLFKDKSLEARNSVVGHFTKRMGLSHRATTHTTQKHFKETEEESNHFIKFMRTKIAGKDPCNIINMDQTPIPFYFHSNKMLETKGTRSICPCIYHGYKACNSCCYT